MAYLIKNVRVIDIKENVDVVDDVYIDEERITIAPKSVNTATKIDGKKKILVPGLIDLHVHFREPGFTYKEDICSGIKAALAGGVTSALAMPNTNPPIDQPKHVFYQQARAKRSGFDLMTASCASKQLLGQEAVDIASLKAAGAYAVTDDGRPIEDDKLMAILLKTCRRHNFLFMQHAEDLVVSKNLSLNHGKASIKLGLLGQPAYAESKMVERDLALALSIGCRYHLLHMSTEESLKLIRKAKRESDLISCEVSPHHLLLCDQDIHGFDTHKKMNPPLRSKEDTYALIEGLCDGSIDAVASDHAPHSCKEKKRPFEAAPFGVVGLESSILVLLTLAARYGLPLKRAIDAMTHAPARILGNGERRGTMLNDHALKNAVLLDPDFIGLFSGKHLHGRSSNSPFIGMELTGKVMATFLCGKLAYSCKDFS